MPTPPHLATPVLVRGSDTPTRDFYEAVVHGFQEEPIDGGFERSVQLAEPRRNYGFQVDGRWVATATSRGRTMVVPGGEVEVGAVTAVTVAPSYRRRGLLSQMMRAQLAELTEPVALLWASEAAIYGRFGYGEATSSVDLTLPTDDATFLPSVRLSDGSVDEVPVDAWVAAVSALRGRLLPERPGALTRSPAQWDRETYDPAEHRNGAGRRRYILHFAADGTPDGWASFRIKEKWDNELPSNLLILRELDAASPEAYARLWRYLIDMDLVRTISWSDAPTDAALYWMLANPRILNRRERDGTYCRILDLPAALQARRYLDDVDLVLELSDPLVAANDGRFRLTITDGAVRLAPSDDAADVSLSIRELGSIYLGGVSPLTLAAAGAVAEHRPGALADLAAAFRWTRAPHCPDHF